ncbi:DALR anticodon-binding domain-containing protein, partial [Reinekea sp.]|uniref:DALR anticodon-binding domain-containing protein n=1 Tax=Reinekea sp. TaxID=1970455 RepID=UPI002A817727
LFGVLDRLAEQKLSFNRTDGLAALSRLDQEADRELMPQLRRYSDIVKSAGEALEPAMIATYLKDLASLFHSYYNNHKMLVKDDEIRNARLVLSTAVAQVLANGLDLLGVSAPEKM